MSNGSVYLLSEDPTGLLPDVIYGRNSSLRIRIFKLSQHTFNPAPDELQFYAFAEGELLAFETCEVYADDLLDTLEAIHWYCLVIGHPEIEILPDDPRLATEMVI